MKKSQKGFTLVELIVVITILAILGTIAFISLQGYSQDARNSKVTSDIRTLASAVETSLTDGSITMSNLVSGDSSATNGVPTTGTFGSGILIASGSYDVGTINFAGLKQNGADFVDNDGNAYIVATALSGTDNAYYQIAGQTANADGSFTAVVKGNYVQLIGTDLTGLITANSSNTAGIVNGSTFTGSTSDLY